MKRSKYTEEQIAFGLKQAELGTPVNEVIRKMGITEQIYYRWKKKYGGLGTSELRRLRQLEEENKPPEILCQASLAALRRRVARPLWRNSVLNEYLHFIYSERSHARGYPSPVLSMKATILSARNLKASWADPHCNCCHYGCYSLSAISILVTLFPPSSMFCQDQTA
jgi:putative transposase